MKFLEIDFYGNWKISTLVDNSTLAPPGSDGYDRLGKVRPVLEHLSKQFIALYNPNRDCSIDVAVIHIKNNRTKNSVARLHDI